VNAAIVVLVVVLGVGLFLAARWWEGEQRRRRHAEFATATHAMGLEAAEGDPLALLDEPYWIFGNGDGRGIDSTARGAIEETPVQVRDYWFYDTQQSGKTRTRRYTRLTVAMVALDADCPHLTLRPENIFGRIADALGARDIELESEEFNRTFTLKSDDRKFASDLVDARMIAWLLEYGQDQSFEVGGRWVITWAPRLSGPQLADLVEYARSFRAQVPRVISSLYPVTAPASAPTS
jgi:hypothetical protein